MRTRARLPARPASGAATIRWRCCRRKRRASGCASALLGLAMGLGFIGWYLYVTRQLAEPPFLNPGHSGADAGGPQAGFGRAADHAGGSEHIDGELGDDAGAVVGACGGGSFCAGPVQARVREGGSARGRRARETGRRAREVSRAGEARPAFAASGEG